MQLSIDDVKNCLADQVLDGFAKNRLIAQQMREIARLKGDVDALARLVPAGESSKPDESRNKVFESQ